MADMVAGFPTPNLSRNTSIAHGVKLFFKDETVAVANQKWRDLGDLSDLTCNPAAEFLEHFSVHDGKNALAKRIMNSRSLTIDATLNEINGDNLRLALYGGAPDDTGTINYPFSEVLSEDAAGDTFTLSNIPVASSVVVYLEGDETALTAVTGYAINESTGVISAGSTAATIEDATKIRVDYTVALTAATKTELFGETNYHGGVQFHILNNEGGVLQIMELDDALVTPSGPMNIPVDGIQSLPITITSLVKNGLIGRSYFKTDV